MTEQQAYSNEENRKVLPPPVSFLKDIIYLDHTDNIGRPVAEMNVDDAILTDITARGVPMKLRACPYEGSRESKAMNVSALGAMSSRMQALETSLVWLRKRTLGDPDQITLKQAMQLGQTGFALASYAYNRGISPHQRQDSLPVEVANLTKVMNGLRMISEFLIDDIGMPSEVVAKPKDLFLAAEVSGAFHTPERVCSAPEGMIVDLFTILFSGDSLKCPEVVDLLDQEFPNVPNIKDKFAPLFSQAINDNGKLQLFCMDGIAKMVESQSVKVVQDFAFEYASRERQFVNFINDSEGKMNIALGRSIQNMPYIPADQIFSNIFPPVLHRQLYPIVAIMRSRL